jgi:hypothetical protein
MHRPVPPAPPPARLAALIAYGGELPDATDPEGRAARDFFANNWRAACDGLLARSNRIRVEPLPPEGPRSFSFEIDLPYKRKQPSGSVELDTGPIRGLITYHASIFAPPAGARSIVVFVTSDGFYHPHHSRAHKVLCLGDLPRGPYPLDALLEHVYSIVTYQNLDLQHFLDRDAAVYFASDLHAFEGLVDVPTLY